jgi:hypothetical protein
VLEETDEKRHQYPHRQICQDLKSRSAGAPDPVFDGYNWFQSSDGMSAERKERKPRRDRSRTRQARRHRSRSGGLGVCLHRLLYVEKQREQLQVGEEPVLQRQ